MAAPCDAAVTWEYRILTIGVRRSSQFNSPASSSQTPDSPAAAIPPSTGQAAGPPTAQPTQAPPAGEAAKTKQDPPQQAQQAKQAQTGADQNDAATSSMSQMYRDLEFPSKYLRSGPAQAAPLPRAKQLEQVLNRLAAEGWEYVGLELLLGEQVVVMRRPRAPEPQQEQQPDTPQPWWRRWRQDQRDS